MELLKGIASGAVLALLLTGMLTLTLGFQPDRAPGTACIRANGSVDPATAPIARDGDVYTFTDDIYGSIVLLKGDVVVDGADFVLQGTGSGTGIDGTAVSSYVNVTIKNTEIREFAVGIELSSFNEGVISGNTITSNGDGIRVSGFGQFSSFNNIISGNTIANNENGIIMEGYVVGNTISGNTIADNSNYGIALITWMPFHSPTEENIVSGNTITNNGNGIYLGESSNNFIYHNNFVNNAEQVYIENSINVWDDGYPSGGNYWSGHVCTGNPSDGSQPYILDENNTDHYPFQDPDGWVIPVDVNVDGMADVYDVVTAGEALASYLGHLRWSLAADLNRDNTVDFIDLILIARNFGMLALIIRWVCWR